MRIVRHMSIGLLAVVALAASARAQDVNALAAAPAARSTATAPTTAGPRQDAVRVGAVAVSASVATGETPLPMRMADTKRSRSLMIIGGAMLLGGAIVGGDAGSIIMLGGLGVGIYGLYLFLQ